MDYLLVDTQTVNDADLAADFVDVLAYTDAAKMVRLCAVVDIGLGAGTQLAGDIDTILTFRLFIAGRFVTESKRKIPEGQTQARILIEPFLLEQDDEAVLKMLSDNEDDDDVDVVARVYTVRQTAEIVELTSEEVLNRVRSIRTYSARTK